MKKRFLTILLSCTMVFSLCACGKGTDNSSNEETKVTNGEVTLEVGSPITGYSVTAFGTEYGDGKWYVLGAEDGK